ncbi:MAG: CHY zinc finger protein [Bacteroidota bacterium]|nr:CHY zinc finger protein [Bacteroidota bacterium]
MNNKSEKKIVRGKTVDADTRCVHYHSPLDVIAIKFKCCNEYYPCYQCHEEEAGHPAEVWKKIEWDHKAILCGACKTEMTIRQYMDSGNQCPYCHVPFNPNCSRHYHLYFEV